MHTAGYCSNFCLTIKLFDLVERKGEMNDYMVV